MFLRCPTFSILSIQSWLAVQVMFHFFFFSTENLRDGYIVLYIYRPVKGLFTYTGLNPTLRIRMHRIRISLPAADPDTNFVILCDLNLV